MRRGRLLEKVGRRNVVKLRSTRGEGKEGRRGGGRREGEELQK
jgi:hypothetical protein